MREWFRHHDGRRDLLTQGPVDERSLRRRPDLSASLHALRLAADRHWRAAGEPEKAWAMRWLRLHCRRLESRPCLPLPPLVARPAMTARELERALARGRANAFDGMLELARPQLRQRAAEQNFYFWVMMLFVVTRALVQLLDGSGGTTVPAAAGSMFCVARISLAGMEFAANVEGHRARRARTFLVGLVIVLAIRHLGLVPSLPGEVAHLVDITARAGACLAGVALGLAKTGFQWMENVLVRLRVGAEDFAPRPSRAGMSASSRFA